MSFQFKDRAEAGRFLAEKLRAYESEPRTLVLGLPRGGIVVAYELARRLRTPLRAFLVRKLGVPGQDELAMGAIAGGGICYLNQSLIDAIGIPRRAIDQVLARERRELERRESVFKIGPPPELRGRVAILVDDGLATGATMRAAVQAAREEHPARIVVAVPVASEEILRQFEEEVDEVACVHVPEDLMGVGQWYEDFLQTEDEEVCHLLQASLAEEQAHVGQH